MNAKVIFATVTVVVIMVPVIQAISCYKCNVRLNTRTNELVSGQEGCDNTTLVNTNTTFRPEHCYLQGRNDVDKDILNPIFKQTYESNVTMVLKCIKEIRTVENQVAIRRGCRYVEKGHSNGCRDMTDLEKKFELQSGHGTSAKATNPQFCECEGDACNSAKALKIPILSVAIVGVFAKFLVV